MTVPVGVIKEALGNSGCMLSWLSLNATSVYLNRHLKYS